MSLHRNSPSPSDQYASTIDPPPAPSPSSTMPSPPSSDNTTLLARIQIYSAQVPTAWVTPLSGAGAGLASGVVTCPLDVVKTKLQAQGGFASRRNGQMASSSTVYKGMLGTFGTIWREEGIRGMYRGLGPMVLGYIPTWAVYMMVYDRSRDYYEEACGNWWLARGCSSLTAGACSTVLTNPIWVVKTRLMSQSNRNSSDGMRAPWHYNSTRDAFRKMYRSEGLRSFYSGLSPALLGLTHVAVQFPLYEFFKMKFTGYSMGEHPVDNASSHWAGISAATFLSKVCASTVTYPHEVLRTRLQTQQRKAPATTEGLSYSAFSRHSSDSSRSPGPSSSDGMPTRPRYKGVIRTFQIILAEEGWTAFYAGIGTNLIRAVPAAMVTMITYEYLKKQLAHLQSEGHRRVEEERKGIGT